MLLISKLSRPLATLVHLCKLLWLKYVLPTQSPLNLNGWVVDRARVGVVASVFGVLGENDIGRRVIDFCVERGSCVGNT